jgi:hypothetical protein
LSTIQALMSTGRDCRPLLPTVIAGRYWPNLSNVELTEWAAVDRSVSS